MGHTGRILLTRKSTKHDGTLNGPKRPKCGSNAHRPTRIWQNLLIKEELENAYSKLGNPP